MANRPSRGEPRRPDPSQSLVVSTTCPNCGAPLDFEEGIHGVACQHCRTSFLITGRKSLQTYSVDPRVDAKHALRAARQALQSRGVPAARLVFIPYYRFTAHDFYWYVGDRAQARRARDAAQAATLEEWKPVFTKEGSGESDFDLLFDREDDHPLSVLIEKGLSLLGVEFRSGVSVRDSGVAAGPPSSAGAARTQRGRADALRSANHRPAQTLVTESGDLKSRLIDRTFIASTTIARPALTTLGFRAATLKLRLFDAARLAEVGTVARVSLPPQAAVERALETPEKEVALRATVSESLSLIYFPYWIMSDDETGMAAVVDGITGRVADTVASPVADELVMSGPVPRPVIELRALTCPNCGNDFPVRPHDVAFLCTSCRRGWQLTGAELRPIEAIVADVGVHPGDDFACLPFWVLSVRTEKETRSVFVAAFRYRNLRNLHQLARQLTGRQPSYAAAEKVPASEMAGCFYDADDARRLSRFLEVRDGVPGEKEEDDFVITKSVLTWIPFAKRGTYLIDPFVRMNLYRSMIAGLSPSPSGE